MQSSFLWFLFALVVGPVSSFRTLTTQYNPGCENECQNKSEYGFANLVYVKSEGPQNTIHHLWSTIGNPSLLLLQMSPESYLNFTWTKHDHFIVPNISLSGKLLYAFAVVFNKIWEFSDPADKGTMSESMDLVNSADFVELIWDSFLTSDHSATEKLSSVVFKTMLNTSDEILDEDKGVISLKLETRGEDGRSDTIPRLLYSSNSSEVRFILDNALLHSGKSRFAVEISIFATEKYASWEDLFKLQTVKTMDDEYTPGVFKSQHLISKESQGEEMSGSYFSWKPVAYTTDTLSVTDSTNTNYETSSNANIETYSVAQSFFVKHIKPYDGFAFNVSFGTAKDGFYLSTNYTQWSFSYGLGIPGEDKISSLVIIVIASGLGLPVLLIILSSVYLIWHKRKALKDDVSIRRR